ncbi:hypothetical protein [Desulfomonile tiedjei]|uniref:Uncharacterized protein n=1 Tax=Desulfomonile tiedjei (strain ATCC 49306 / DSM 6799 / DCB-1) TaxID=706587 RepID=I4CDY2_DESTA|nr:hypothetical protein [Desulfomonile tiedjei]AFM27773.1 hypothetical protein Desti_5171 [Desulfomonile tiedjei DSM 6799]
MLQMRIVGGIGTVDVFDGHSWTHQSGVLQFLDTRYAMSGWHGMNEFAVEYYDGVGYDGEPLRVVDGWEAEQPPPDPDDPQPPFVLNTLTGTGAQENPPPPDAVITRWETYVFGGWSGKLLTSWAIANPSPDYNPDTYTQNTTADSASAANQLAPLTVVCQASDYWWGEKAGGEIQSRVGENVIWFSYSPTGYSLERLVNDLNLIYYCHNKTEIENLVILNHNNRGEFWIGSTHLKPSSLWHHTFFNDPSSQHLSSFDMFKTYGELFHDLDYIMKDGGQIQHYGCQPAGFYPYAETCDPSLLDSPGSPEYQSLMGRRMLATIAHLSNTFVFASSDKQMMSISKDAWPGKEIAVGELCLEFGVNPQGFQVNYTACNQKPWNIEMFTPEELQPNQSTTYGLQTLWDGEFKDLNERKVSTRGESYNQRYDFITES